MLAVPDHIVNVRANLRQVDRLLDIHANLTGTSPGRRHDVQVLNRSAVLLLVATWEAYVEDLAISGCRTMVEGRDSYEQLPKLALVMTAQRLKSEKDETSTWKLAGDGWKNELLAQAEIEASKLHSPNAAKIEALFKNTLGLQSFSKNWHWTGCSRENVIGRLNTLIEVRGDIAHRGETSDPVTKAYVERSADLVRRLAAITSNRVRDHISAITGADPWPRYGAQLDN